MRVAHVNVSDTKGGAARAAFRLHHALREAEIDSWMVVSEKYSSSERVLVPLKDQIGYWQRRLRWRQLSVPFWHYVLSRPAGLGLFTSPRATRNRALVDRLPAFDLVNLHWIAGYVDLPSFLTSIPRPVVWTLHDMNAMTGGCHYTLGCRRFLTQCGACPQLGSRTPSDVSRRIWLLKASLFNSQATRKLHLVTPSAWLAGEVRRSPLLSRLPISVIPNAVNTSVYRPRKRAEAREHLQIPPTKTVIMFAADALADRRKGFSLLLEALSDTRFGPDVLLVSFGAGRTSQKWSVASHDLGRLQDEALIAQAYSAADLFIAPSLQDNFPNTVLEAMACGTPVVAFAVGGIPEMVRPGQTGMLAPSEDVDGLRHSILSLLGDEDLHRRLAANCRQIALAEYSLEIQSSRYIELYQQLLEEKVAK